jgi:hypothetical protein
MAISDNSKLTRRSALAGAAAVPAVLVAPAVAAGAHIAHLDEGHPDARLFELWANFEAVERERHGPLREWDDRIEAEAAKICPPLPDALCDFYRIPRGSPYGAHTTGPVTLVTGRDDPNYETCRDLQLDANHARMAARRACGYDEWEAMDAELWDRREGILEEIMATDAATPDGLLIKLDAKKAWAVVAEDEDDFSLSSIGFDSLVRSVKAMGGRYV